MDFLQKNWFAELGELWPGQAFSFEYQEVLYHKKSKFQDVLVLQSKNYGRVLILDGAVQCTERDEFAYQEMIAHVPLCSHKNPKRVLVVGGGDGGVLREVVKHDSVESVDLCEIDADVIEVSKKFLPFMASGFNNPKVKIYVEDGFEFLKNKKHEYDVIITDSSDPIGPAASLYQGGYFGLLKEALREGGIICSQAENIWLHLGIIKDLINTCKLIFSNVEYAYVTIPTYPSGQIGFVLCGSDSCKIPKRKISEKEQIELKYYNSTIHTASFTLPEFAKKALPL